MGSLTAMVSYTQFGGTNSRAFMELNLDSYELDTGGALAAGFGPQGHAAKATITPTRSAAGHLDLAARHT
jgi:hypothetical protein